MRIAFFNHSAEVSGAEISLLQTIEAVARHGVETLVIVPEAGELVNRVRALGLEHRTGVFGAPRLTNHPVHLVRGFRDILRGARCLGRLLAGEIVDLVHANSVRAGLMASFGIPRHRRPVVWSVRDFVPATPLGLAVRIVARGGAAGLIPNSRAVASRFAWPGLSRRTTVVHPSLPPSAFETQSGPGLREAWGIPASALVAGYVGQIAPWKRIHDAIEAFAAVARERDDVWMAIVGAPKFRPENHAYLGELRALPERLGVAGRVRFRGFCDDVRAVYRSLDILVHPAEREPFGRVIVEAMAQGVPIVAAADGGIPEIVTDGENGLLFPVGDVTRIAALLKELLHDADRRLELGRRGRQRALEAFQIDRTIPALLAAYERSCTRA